MPRLITALLEFTTSLFMPQNGEDATTDSIEGLLQGLANRTAYLKQNLETIKDDAVKALIKRSGDIWVDVVSGDDTTGLIKRPDKPFRTLDAALTASTAITGMVTIRLSPGRHAAIRDEHQRWRDNVNPALHSTLRDNVRLIGSGRPLPKVDRTGLDEATGTVIDGPFICQRVNFQTMDLGVDSGQEVCNRLWIGAAQEALVMAYYGSPTYLINETPRPGHHHHNVAGMCQSPSAAVHACLFENLLNPSVSDVYSYFGVHGIVFKTSGGIAHRLYNHGHAGEGVIVKASNYAACGELQITDVQCRTLQPVGGGTAVGAGVQLHAGEPGVLLAHIQVKGIMALQTSYTLDILGGNGSTSGVVADCEVSELIGINNTSFGVRGRGSVSRMSISGQVLSPTGIGLDMDDAGVSDTRLDITVVNATGDGLKTGGLRTRLLRAVVTGSAGVGLRNSSASTELYIGAFENNTGGDRAGIAVLERVAGKVETPTLIPPVNSWVNTGGTEVPLSAYRDRGRVYLTGTVQGGASGVSLGQLPVGYRPANNLALTVWCNDSTPGLITVTTAGALYVNVYGGGPMRINVDFPLA